MSAIAYSAATVAVDYGLELDFASLPRLVAEHGVRFG